MYRRCIEQAMVEAVHEPLTETKSIVVVLHAVGSRNEELVRFHRFVAADTHTNQLSSHTTQSMFIVDSIPVAQLLEGCLFLANHEVLRLCRDGQPRLLFAACTSGI